MKTKGKNMVKNVNYNFIENKLIECEIPYTEESIEKLLTCMELVLEKNKVMNLTAITDKVEFIKKHFFEAFQVGKIIKNTPCEKILDLGTGAGFPGVPLAILFPEKKIYLLDSLNKRINFINEVLVYLKCNNGQTLCDRAEVLGRDTLYREKFDIVVSRAVARLNVLFELSIPFVRVGGYFVCYKGKSYEEELKEAEKGLSLLGGCLKDIQPIKNENEEIAYNLIVCRKENETNSIYPRNMGNIKRKPL